MSDSLAFALHFSFVLLTLCSDFLLQEHWTKIEHDPVLNHCSKRS